MKTQNEKNPNQIHGIVKYILGLLGFLGVLLAILTLTGGVEWYLAEIEYDKAFQDQEKLILSLTSSIIGILFLFIAFSKQIDKFFAFLETHEIKTKKDENAKGITIESIFFFVIAVVLIVLAIMLGMGYLSLKTELPVLKGATKGVLIGALVFLSILAIITTFNNIVTQSVKEMKKVHWPTGKQMLDYSAKVFTFIIFFSVFFVILDLLVYNVPRLVEDLFNK